jgi:uncharacterized repeat protein (TIGR03987 family)
MIAIASILMTLALLLYSAGVWTEHRAGKLKVSHLLLFWAGFVFDAMGTHIMMSIHSGFVINFKDTKGLHGLTGFAGISIMLLHAAWATIVLLKKNEKMKAVFHRFSICAWVFWLIPFLIGTFMGMLK